MPVRQIFQLIAALCLVVSGCTSGSTASSPDASGRAPANAEEEGPMCGNFAVNKVAHSLTRNLCTMDYIWSLVGPEGADTNLTTCAASYVVAGAAVAGSSAYIGRRLLEGDGSFQRVITSERSGISRNTPNVVAWLKELDEKAFVHAPPLSEADPKYTPGRTHTEAQRERIRLQAIARLFESHNVDYSRKYLGNYKSSTLDALSLQPHRRIRAHFGGTASDPFYLGVTPGPTETQARLGRSLLRLSYLGAATMATGGVLFVADQLMGATPTACDEIAHQHYSADPNDNCRPRLAISPEVVQFLNLDPEEQRRLTGMHPQLCGVYNQIAAKIDGDMAKSFDAAAVADRCERDHLAVDVTLANTAKAEIAVDGKEIRIQTHADQIRAQYERTDRGMKLTSIRWASYMGGVRPRTFKLPVDSETLNLPLFQNVQSRLGTYILVMENKGLFGGECLKRL